jgi:hypothetical protein
MDSAITYYSAPVSTPSTYSTVSEKQNPDRRRGAAVIKARHTGCFCTPPPPGSYVKATAAAAPAPAPEKQNPDGRALGMRGVSYQLDTFFDESLCRSLCRADAGPGG